MVGEIGKKKIKVKKAGSFSAYNSMPFIESFNSVVELKKVVDGYHSIEAHIINS